MADHASKPTQVSDTARAEMESIVRRVTSGGDVDPRAADELYGHLEDKLINYLNGEERLTEADALILVREHFGHPDSLRPLLSNVHAVPESAGPPLWRRVAAATVVLCAATAVVSVAHHAIVYGSVLVMLKRGATPEAYMPWLATGSWVAGGAAANLAVVAILCLAWRRWRSPGVAERAWIGQWKPYTFLLALLAILVINAAGIRLIGLASRSVSVSESPSDPLQPYMQVLICASIAGAGLQCLAWTGWVASPYRRAWRPAAVAAGAWVLYFPLTSVAHLAVHLAMPGGAEVTVDPWNYALQTAYAAAVAAPVLAIYLAPRVFRWLGARIPSRVIWAAR